MLKKLTKNFCLWTSLFVAGVPTYASAPDVRAPESESAQRVDAAEIEELTVSLIQRHARSAEKGAKGAKGAQSKNPTLSRQDDGSWTMSMEASRIPRFIDRISSLTFEHLGCNKSQIESIKLWKLFRDRSAAHGVTLFRSGYCELTVDRNKKTENVMLRMSDNLAAVLSEEINHAPHMLLEAQSRIAADAVAADAVAAEIAKPRPTAGALPPPRIIAATSLPTPVPSEPSPSVAEPPVPSEPSPSVAEPPVPSEPSPSVAEPPVPSEPSPSAAVHPSASLRTDIPVTLPPANPGPISSLTELMKPWCPYKPEGFFNIDGTIPTGVAPEEFVGRIEKMIKTFGVESIPTVRLATVLAYTNNPQFPGHFKSIVQSILNDTLFPYRLNDTITTYIVGVEEYLAALAKTDKGLLVNAPGDNSEVLFAKDGSVYVKMSLSSAFSFFSKLGCNAEFIRDRVYSVTSADDWYARVVELELRIGELSDAMARLQDSTEVDRYCDFIRNHEYFAHDGYKDAALRGIKNARNEFSERGDISILGRECKRIANEFAFVATLNETVETPTRCRKSLLFILQRALEELGRLKDEIPGYLNITYFNRDAFVEHITNLKSHPTRIRKLAAQLGPNDCVIRFYNN